MYKLLEKMGEQVQSYTTGLGTVWYILVFGFRLFVVSTVGDKVYGDEQGAFKCSETVVGCTTQCYNQFAKISHIRFWAFQIVAVSTPTIFFHLYATYVASQVSKIEAAEEAVKKLEADADGDAEVANKDKMMKEVALISKRKQRLGQFKMKEVIRGEKKIKIPQTKKMILANLLNLVVRLTLEVIFIIIGAHLFNVTSEGRQKHLTVQKFLWNDVPGYYQCRKDGSGVDRACSHHFTDSHKGFVPCFVSRPYEKTFLLRYMTWVNFICVFITVYEIIALVVRSTRHRKNRRRFDRDAAMDGYSSMVGTHRNTIKPSLPDYTELEGIYPNLQAENNNVMARPSASVVRNGKLVKVKRTDGNVSMCESDAMSVRSHRSRQSRSRSQGRL